MRQLKKQQLSNNLNEQSSDSSENEASSEQEEEIIEREMHQIKQQLKNMPYELILKQKAIIQHPQKQGKVKTNQKQKKTKKIQKKQLVEEGIQKDKKASKQISIHKRTFKQFKPIFEPIKKKGIDPRFETYAGNYNQDLAMKSFGFIPKLQQAEITEIKGKLKNPSKRNKINAHQREILTQEYNKLTSDYKRVELMQLEKQTKKELKEQHGEDFHMKKNEFRQQFEKRKFIELNEGQREKKLRDKETKVQRNYLNERRKTLHLQPRGRRQ